MRWADGAALLQCEAGGGTANPPLALAGCTGVGWTKPDPEAGAEVGAGTTKPEPEAWLELDAAGVGADRLCATRLFA
jgi:hypothetical protein